MSNLASWGSRVSRYPIPFVGACVIGIILPVEVVAAEGLVHVIKNAILGHEEVVQRLGVRDEKAAVSLEVDCRRRSGLSYSLSFSLSLTPVELLSTKEVQDTGSRHTAFITCAMRS